MSDSTSTIKEEKLVSIIGGTVEDLKEYVEEQNPDSKLLNRLLEDEKAAKNRKTAKEYLRKKLKERKVGGDFKKARKELEDVERTLEHIKRQEIGSKDFSKEETEDIDSVKEIGLLEGDFEDVKEFVNDRNPSVKKTKELIEGEKKAQDRQRVKNLLHTFIRQKKLYKDINNAQYHIGKVREDFAEIEEESEYISPDLLETHEPHEAIEENLEEASEESSSKEPEETLDESEGKKGSDSEDSEENIEKESTDDSDKESEDSELEEKKALLEDLDVDMSEEKLKEIDKAQLEALKDEKSEREKLIDDLKEIGMDEEELRNSSTKDLKTLKEELDGGGEDSESEDSESSEDDSDKDEEELEEEAEEDLEMLMGSVKNNSSEEKGRDPLDQLKDMKKQFKDLWNTPEKDEEDEVGIDGDKVVDLLDHYEERPEKEQAIKTAHVMKGFLEYRMDIDREMTYEELAETLDEIENASEDIKVLQDFFEKMSEDEYTDHIQVDNMDQVIASSKVVIEELN